MPLDSFIVYRENRPDGTVHHINEGPAADTDKGTKVEQLLGKILTTLRSRPDSTMARVDLAIAVGVDPKNRTLAWMTPREQLQPLPKHRLLRQQSAPVALRGTTLAPQPAGPPL